MSLKSALHITLAVAILFGALSGIIQPGLHLAGTSGQELNPNTQSVGQGITAPHQPILACPGCSGNGGGPA